MTKRSYEIDSKRDREIQRRQAEFDHHLNRAKEALERSRRELIKLEVLRELSER